MTSQVVFRNRIEFANYILKSQKIDIGKQVFYYNLKKYKQKGSFNNVNNISEHVTLVQLMNSLGNVNHAIRVLGSWILYFNDEVALVLNIKSLDIICAPFVG